MSSIHDAIADHLGGGHHEATPAKEIDHIKSYKSKTKGDVIHEHHHTRPEHHPMEKHTTRGDDEMAAHMMANLGTPNPGEGQDANTAPPETADASAGAPAAAPAGSGMAGGAVPVGA